MENNKWERQLDRYQDFVSSPLEMIESIKDRRGSLLAIAVTPFASLTFIAKMILTSPWGLFLVAARIWERR